MLSIHRRPGQDPNSVEVYGDLIHADAGLHAVDAGFGSKVDPGQPVVVILVRFLQRGLDAFGLAHRLPDQVVIPRRRRNLELVWRDGARFRNIAQHPTAKASIPMTLTQAVSSVTLNLTNLKLNLALRQAGLQGAEERRGADAPLRDPSMSAPIGGRLIYR